MVSFATVDERLRLQDAKIAAVDSEHRVVDGCLGGLIGSLSLELRLIHQIFRSSEIGYQAG